MKSVSHALLLLALLPLTCMAESGLGYRLGTLGFGLDYGHRWNDSITLRVGYNFYQLQRKTDRDGVQYNASLKVNTPEILADWHFNHSPWRASFGLVQSGPQLMAIGRATGGNITINGQPYATDQVGKIAVSIKASNVVAPYIGVGWGDVVGSENRFGFLFDMGVLYTGAPKSHVTAQCGAALANTGCDQLVSDIRAEALTQERKGRHVQWWPMLAVGFAMRWQ